jgi:glycosyltransferase involved in cell wall biosynthesis
VGRMNREKGAHRALAMARGAGMRLVLAGPLAPRPWDLHYFEREVRPQLDSDRAIYLGELGPADMDRVYRGAACALFPMEWEEPFSLAVVEAMARGVPVIATHRGALPEVVEEGINGFLVQSIHEGAQRAREAARIDRARCCESARTRFNWETTGAAYLELIWKALGEER